MKKVSEYNSTKIRVLQFVAIMMVLYIHGVYLEAAEVSDAAQYLQDFLAISGLSIVANPLFFFVSGYLFFLGMERKEECFAKMKKRVGTLLVPYILWNIIFVLWYVVLAVVPGVARYVNSDIVGAIASGGVIEGFRKVFIEPAAFQLWFVRDLMVYVALSPFICVCLQKMKVAAPVVMFLLATVALFVLPLHIKLWGAFFFVLGGYVALCSSLDRLTAVLTPAVVALCAVVYVGNAVVSPLHILPLQGTEVLVQVCGLVVVWRLYDYCKNKKNRYLQRLATLGKYSFFIYLFHEPAFNIIKKMGLKVLGCGEWQLVVLYLINPILMCAFAILVAKLLQRAMPRIYAVLVGGR